MKKVIICVFAIMVLLVMTKEGHSIDDSQITPKVFPKTKLIGDFSEAEYNEYFNIKSDKSFKGKHKEKKAFKDEENIRKMIDVESLSSVRMMDSNDKSNSYSFWRKNPPPYAHSSNQIGYLSFDYSSDIKFRKITAAHRIDPDNSIKVVDIRLDRLRVYDYPGSKVHQVMFSFEAINDLDNTENKQERVKFSQIYRVAETEGAGIEGYPIFRNLHIGNIGASFKGATINIENDSDENALKILKSDEFNAGLGLLATAQPAIGPFTAIGTGLAEMVLSRNKNVKVQEFNLGLDFDKGAAYGVRIAEGNYIVVQAQDEGWDWNKWRYDLQNCKIVREDTKGDVFPYNYIIFRVSKHK